MLGILISVFFIVNFGVAYQPCPVLPLELALYCGFVLWHEGLVYPEQHGYLISVSWWVCPSGVELFPISMLNSS